MNRQRQNGTVRVLRQAGGGGLLLGAFVANLGEGIMHTALAANGGALLDTIAAFDRRGMLGQFGRAFLYAALLALCIIIKDYELGVYQERGMVRIRRKTVEVLGKARMSWLYSKHTGELSARVSADLNALGNALRPVLIMGLSAPARQLITIGYMFYVNWLLTLLVLAISPVTTLLQWAGSRPIKRYRFAHQDALGSLSSVVFDCLGSFETVKSLSLEEEMRGRFAAAQSRQREAALNETRISALLVPFSLVGQYLPQLVIVLAGGMFIIGGSLTIGQLAAFLALSATTTRVIGNMGGLIASLRQLGVNAGRIAELWDVPEEASGRQERLTGQAPIVELRQVSFTYEGEKEAGPVLDGASLQVGAGAFAALVGESGCGKSTVLRLIATLYEPTAGEVRIGGCPGPQWEKDALRRHMAYVTQETYLFPGTLVENITCGEEPVDSDWLECCLKTAQLEGFAASLPKGLETVVGERGVFLSGGQRQRIAIARALYKRAPLLLLDEATSALDKLTEGRVISAVLALPERPALMMVTHRLENLREAEMVFVLRHGQVVEQGVHSRLLEQGGEYARLWALQEGGDMQ